MDVAEIDLLDTRAMAIGKLQRTTNGWHAICSNACPVNWKSSPDKSSAGSHLDQLLDHLLTDPGHP